MLALAFTFALACADSRRAHAIDGFLEPYVGFGKFQVATKNTFYNDFDQKSVTEGFMLGMKGGISFSGRYFAGMDYFTGGPYKFGRQLNKGEWSVRMFGGGLGMDYKVVRFWGGYYPSVTIDDSVNLYKLVGTATKIGFGLTVVKNIRANLDLIFFDIDKRKTFGEFTDECATEVKCRDYYQMQQANVSISLPIDIK